MRAVVGSLVLCAALGQSANAQTAPSEVQEFRTPHTSSFRALLQKTQRLIEAGELSAQDTFDFTLEAGRNDDGTLRDIKFTESAAANGRWRSLAHEFVAVLSESGALSGLKGADHLTFTLRLDERASARLNAVVNSAEQAAQLAQNYRALLDLARVSQRARARIEVLNNMAFSANGKQLTMQLEMSREQAGNLLRKQLSLP